MLSQIKEANSFMQERNWESAECIWKDLINSTPFNSEYLYNLSICYWEQRKIPEALFTLNKIPSEFKNYSVVLNQKGNIYSHIGEAEKARKAYNEALQLNPTSIHCWSNYLFSLLYDSTLNASFVSKEHQRFGDLFEPKSEKTIKKTSLIPHKKLKVGFLSADFKLHSVAYFFEPLLSEFDKKRFEIHLYNVSSYRDDMTDHLERSADKMHILANKTLIEKVAIIKKNEIDILIDLGGHTGNNALEVMMQQPAPIQLSWLGYPHSTGLKTIDYRLSDSIIEPLPESQKNSSETIIHLPQGCHRYRMPTEGQPIPPLPCIKNGFITFICCNNSAKISQRTLELWAKILQKIPESKLIIKNSGFQFSDKKEELLSYFEDCGVNSERLDIRPLTADFQEHISTYGNADIALDTYPYNGTTTTCEAFWSGVPVLTLQGKTAESRHGASLMSQVDLNDWIATDPQSYIDKAVQLTSNIDQLKMIRNSLRSRMIRSSLGDYKWMARRFESVLLNLFFEFLKKHNSAETSFTYLKREAEEKQKSGFIAHLFRRGSLAISEGAIDEAQQCLMQAAQSEKIPEAWVALAQLGKAIQNVELEKNAWLQASIAFPDHPEFKDAYQRCTQNN